MRQHMKRILGYLLAITIIISDIPIVVNAEANVDSASQSVETVAETASTPDEAEIISELTEKRDETTKYFAMSDGTIKVIYMRQMVHLRRLQHQAEAFITSPMMCLGEQV